MALSAWVIGSALGAPGPGPSALAYPVLEVGAAHPAKFFPSVNSKKPIFILALGSDARANEPVAKSRADSIHIIGINPAKHSASILGFPRDSYVDIPGHGTDKINSSMSAGGPKLTIKTLEQLTGIHIDYYVLTSFRGVRGAITAVGGVTVNVLCSMHDQYSGADFDPGKHHFSGDEALAFARDRHSLPQGDLDRSVNQGRLFMATLQEFHRQFSADPSQLLVWLGAGLRNVETDLPMNQLLKLAFTAAKVPLNKVTNQIVPATGGVVGSADVVFIQGGAKPVYQDLKDDGLIEKQKESPSGCD
jgi:LCP family protein required for cell wall assembly